MLVAARRCQNVGCPSATSPLDARSRPGSCRDMVTDNNTVVVLLQGGGAYLSSGVAACDTRNHRGERRIIFSAMFLRVCLCRSQFDVYANCSFLDCAVIMLLREKLWCTESIWLKMGKPVS